MMTSTSGVVDIPLHNIFPSQHGHGWLRKDDNQIILSVLEYAYVYTCVCVHMHTCVSVPFSYEVWDLREVFY